MKDACLGSFDYLLNIPFMLGLVEFRLGEKPAKVTERHEIDNGL
jgi:hypothetical protein